MNKTWAAILFSAVMVFGYACGDSGTGGDGGTLDGATTTDGAVVKDAGGVTPDGGTVTDGGGTPLAAPTLEAMGDGTGIVKICWSLASGTFKSLKSVTFTPAEPGAKAGTPADNCVDVSPLKVGTTYTFTATIVSDLGEHAPATIDHTAVYQSSFDLNAANKGVEMKSCMIFDSTAKDGITFDDMLGAAKCTLGMDKDGNYVAGSQATKVELFLDASGKYTGLVPAKPTFTVVPKCASPCTGTDAPAAGVTYFRMSMADGTTNYWAFAIQAANLSGTNIKGALYSVNPKDNDDSL